MSKTTEEIIKKLKEIGGHSFINVPGKAVSVNETDKTAVVSIDGTDYPDIRLNAVISEENENHSYIVPVLGSWVMVSFIENSDTDGFICSFSEIDKVVLNANEIVFNKGELKGMVEIEPLIDDLNAIKDDINALKQALSSWVPVPNDGGAALKSATTSWSGSQLQQTQIEDIENDKIKQ
jgi:hypothetical protein